MTSIDPNPRITFGIAYEDDDVLVVEKPARVPTQPGKGHQTDTLLNGLFAIHANKLQNLGRDRDFGLLHRLDKDTSGLLVVALKPHIYDALRADFAERRIKKYYWAICSRAPQELSGVIKMPIVETLGSLGKGAPKLAHVAKVGKPAVTAYRVLDTSEMAALIEARPVTGRLHQVRVHLEAIGCPILGDPFYGPRRVRGASSRLALHAHRLCFTHPRTGELIDAKSDWPKDLRRVLRNTGLMMPQPTASSKVVGAAESDETHDEE